MTESKRTPLSPPSQRKKSLRGYIFDSTDRRLVADSSRVLLAVNTSQDVRSYHSPITRVVGVHITQERCTQDSADGRIVSFRGVVICEGVVLKKGSASLTLARGTLVQGELITPSSGEIMGWLTDRDTARRLRQEQFVPLRPHTAD